MLLLDALMRYPTIIGFLFLIALASRAGWEKLPIQIGVCLCISLAALFFKTAPLALLPPQSALHILGLLTIPNLGLIWWFGQLLLDDNFQLGKTQWAGLVLLSLPNVGGYMQTLGIATPDLGYAQFFLALVVPTHLIWLAVTKWDGDLLAPRRHARLYFVVWLIISLTLLLSAENLNYPEKTLSLLRLVLVFPTVWFVILRMTKLHPTTFLFLPAQTETAPYAQAAIVERSMQHTTPEYQRLMNAINDEKMYLDPTLTIGSLAKKCGIAEHQLRKLINKELGYRNFPAFLNNYRIRDAKLLLIDDSPAKLPIITIAMDCGFQTLSTFNRAFRSAQGQSPSAFRAQHPASESFSE